MESIEAISTIIKENDEISDFCLPVEVKVIYEAEKELNVLLPNDYREFLLRFGCGNLGSQEVYGVGIKPVGIPSVIWATKEQRLHEPNFPHEYILFHNSGCGGGHCLDTSRISGDVCPIVRWEIGCNDKLQAETISDSFSQFILKIFKDELQGRNDD